MLDKVLNFLLPWLPDVIFTTPSVLRFTKKFRFLRPYVCKEQLKRLGIPSFDAPSFINSAAGGQSEQVELFIDGGIDVNATGNNLDRALIAASRHGHEKVLRLLLKQSSIEVNARNESDDTALIESARANRRDVVKTLLEDNRVDPNLRNRADESALLEAVRRDYKPIVKLLQGRGAVELDLDKKVARWKITEMGRSFSEENFFDALQSRSINEVKLFITAGIDLEHKDSEGNTAIIRAAQHADPAFVRGILKNGANVNASNNVKDTALIVASRHGHLKTVEALLDAQIDIDLRNDKDESAWIAAIQSGSADIESLLESRKADSRGVKEWRLRVQFQKRGRFTGEAFFESCNRGWITVVEDYLTAGIDVNARGIDGEPALVAAVRRGEPRLVNLLLGEPVLNVNARADGGDPALILALRNGHDEIFQGLLSHAEIDVNQAGVSGDTALIVAARMNYEASVRGLLKGSSIDVNATNDEEESALLEAARRDFAPIVSLLRKHGATHPDLQRKVAHWQLVQKGLFTDAELLQSTRVRDVDRVKKLMIAGLPPDRARNGEGNSALLLAAQIETNELLVETLLEFGAAIEDRNLRGDTALIVAARHGREATVKCLLKSDADVDARNNLEETPLLEAARRKFDKIVKLLRKYGAQDPELDRKVARWQLEQEEAWIESNFVRAAKKGDIDKVKQYLLAGMPIDATDDRDETALIAATRGKKTEMVEFLVQNGVDVNARDREGVSAMEIAWSRRFEQIVDLLTAKGTEWTQEEVARRRLREAGIPNRLERFIDAAAQGQDAYVLLFLDAGMDVNAEDRSGRRVLVEAAKAGQKSVVELLLKHNADPNLRDGFGISAREAAERNEYEDVAGVLASAGAESAQKHTERLVDAVEKADVPEVKATLKAKASPDVYTNAGQPLLMEAVLAERGDIASDLIANGARADARDVIGMTPLMRAAELGLVEMMRLLLATKSAGLDESDPEGRTALIIACRKGHVGAASTLIEAGANQEMRDHDGYTALMVARAKGHERIVEMLNDTGNTERMQYTFDLLKAATRGEHNEAANLIQQGAAVNGIPDEDGNTPLGLAAARGWAETMKVLIEAGAKVDAANRDGDTPLMLAARAGRVEAVEILLQQKGSHALCGATNNHDETPLFQAAMNGRGPVVERLAPFTDQPDLGANGRIPLVEMCYQGDKKAVLALIAVGADVNQQQVTLGTSPLMAAMLSGHMELAEILKINGAWAGEDEAQLFLKAKSGDEEGLRELNLTKINLNARNHDGWTALMEAANAGHDGVVKILLDHGADADLPMLHGNETALRLAALRGRSGTLALLIKKTQRRKSSDARALIGAAARGHAEAVRLLVKQANAPVNGLKSGQIPLVEAASGGHLQAVKVLLDLGADQDRATRRGVTALSAAMLNDYQDVVDLLLQRGAKTQVRDILLLKVAGKPDLVEVKRLLALSDPPNLNARDEAGRTPMMLACNAGTEAVVAELLRCYDQDKVRLAVLDRDYDHNTPLMWAAKAGRPTLIQRLLELGADVYATSKKNRTALMAACRSGNYRSVRILLDAHDSSDRNVAVNQQDDDGNSPLSEALLGAYGKYPRDYQQIVSLLERFGASQGREHAELRKAIQNCDLAKTKQYIGKIDLNKFRPKSKTALMLAAESGCLKVVEYLLERGVDVDERGPSDATALILAASKANTTRADEEIIRLLLERHADYDWTDKKNCSALLHAVEQGHETIVRALIKAGANVNQRDCNGNTALILAVEKSRAAIVRLLLEDPRKVDLEVWTSDRRTALTLARLLNNKPDKSIVALPPRGEPVPEAMLAKLTEIETLLINAGARAGWDEAEMILAIRNGNASRAKKLLTTVSVDTRDLNGNTPLLLACKLDDLSLVRSLLKKRASAEVRNLEERTPLIEAAKNGSRELVNELLQAEPHLDVNAQDNKDETALLVAARAGAANVVMLLLEHKADPSVTSRSGSTPLIEMSHHQQVNAVRALLEQGSNACACTIRNRTAIIEAAAEGHYDILELLLNHLKTRLVNKDEKRTVIVNAVDDQSCTALDWAERGKHRKCSTLLKSHGGQSKVNTPFTVWTSPKGDSYHRKPCPRIKDARKRDKLTDRLQRDAVRDGYAFCLTCKPGHETIDWRC